MPSLSEFDVLVGQPASRKEINLIRDNILEEPITVNDRRVDFDQRSASLMSAVLLAWDELYGTESVNWVCADDSVMTLDRASFTALLSDLHVKHAQRIEAVHKQSRLFKSKVDTLTRRDIARENW